MTKQQFKELYPLAPEHQVPEGEELECMEIPGEFVARLRAGKKS